MAATVVYPEEFQVEMQNLPLMTRIQSSLTWLSQIAMRLGETGYHAPGYASYADEDAISTSHPALFAYAAAVISARLMALDSEINRRESDAFLRLFSLSGVSAGQLRMLYHAALKDTAPHIQYMRQLATLLAPVPALKREAVRRLARIALADGPLEIAEYDFIAELAGIFGLSASDTALLISEAEGPLAAEPYKLLRLRPQASKEMIQRAYRDRIRYCHPDRWAHARHKEFCTLMHRKSTALNLAYHSLMQQQGRNEQGQS